MQKYCRISRLFGKIVENFSAPKPSFVIAPHHKNSLFVLFAKKVKPDSSSIGFKELKSHSFSDAFNLLFDRGKCCSALTYTAEGAVFKVDCIVNVIFKKVGMLSELL